MGEVQWRPICPDVWMGLVADEDGDHYSIVVERTANDGDAAWWATDNRTGASGATPQDALDKLGLSVTAPEVPRD